MYSKKGVLLYGVFGAQLRIKSCSPSYKGQKCVSLSSCLTTCQANKTKRLINVNNALYKPG